MDFCSIIYYNLNIIKNNLIYLIQNLENILQQVSTDFTINPLTIENLTHYIYTFNKSHLNNDIILQKICELTLYSYDINFLSQFWSIISIELYNNYLLINNILQLITNKNQSKANITEKLLTQIRNIKESYYQNSLIANYQLFISSSGFINKSIT